MNWSRREIVSAALAARFAFAQDPAVRPPEYHAQAALVRVHIEVLNGGRFVQGLKQGDFELFDSGRRVQPSDLLESEEPLDLVLLFDVSGSMEPRVTQVARSARLALEDLRPEDRVAVMTFARWSKVVLEFTSNLAEVETVISRDVIGANFRGDTHLLAAVDEAARHVSRKSPRGRRRAVLLFSDNRGAVTLRESTVVRRLWEADASLSLVELPLAGYEQPGMGSMLAPGAGVFATVDRVVEQTGGDIVRGNRPGDAFRQMMRLLRTRYLLLYAMPPGKAGEVRKIEVRLSEAARRAYPDAIVRARSGYVVPRAVE